jgi:hypothetical protein
MRLFSSWFSRILNYTINYGIGILLCGTGYYSLSHKAMPVLHRRIIVDMGEDHYVYGIILICMGVVYCTWYSYLLLKAQKDKSST